MSYDYNDRFDDDTPNWVYELQEDERRSALLEKVIPAFRDWLQTLTIANCYFEDWGNEDILDLFEPFDEWVDVDVHSYCSGGGWYEPPYQDCDYDVDFSIDPKQFEEFLEQGLDYKYYNEGGYWYYHEEFELDKLLDEGDEYTRAIFNNGDWICSLNYDQMIRLCSLVKGVNNGTATDEEKYAIEHFKEDKNALASLLHG